MEVSAKNREISMLQNSAKQMESLVRSIVVNSTHTHIQHMEWMRSGASMLAMHSLQLL